MRIGAIPESPGFGPSEPAREAQRQGRPGEWSDGDVEALRALVAQALTWERVASLMGRTVRSVRGKANKLRLKTAAGSFWSEARVLRLREGMATFESYQEVADFIGEGCNKDQVREKGERLGIVRPIHRTWKRVKPPQKRKAASVSQARRAAAWAPLEGSTPLILMDLPERACKWPVGGVGADMLFCGEGRYEAAPYCRHHLDLAVGAE